MEKEGEIIGSLGPEGIIDAPKSEELEQEETTDPEQSSDIDRFKNETLPVLLTIANMGIFFKRLQGGPGIEASALRLTEQLNLRNESDEGLKARVRETTEDEWKVKPGYFTAVYNECKKRKFTPM